MQANTGNFPALAGDHPEGFPDRQGRQTGPAPAGFHVSLSGNRGAGADDSPENDNRQLAPSGGAGVTLEF